MAGFYSDKRFDQVAYCSTNEFNNAIYSMDCVEGLPDCGISAGGGGLLSPCLRIFVL